VELADLLASSNPNTSEGETMVEATPIIHPLSPFAEGWIAFGEGKGERGNPYPSHDANSLARGTMERAMTTIELQPLGARKTLAHASACKAVKDNWRKEGIKLGQFSGREISLAADCYLCAHPELLVEAAERVERWVAEGKLGKRAQLAWSQRAELVSPAQREKA